MKTIPITLLKSTAWAIYIERLDGASFGWTTHDEDATIGSQLYRSGPGLDIDALVSTAGLGVDNSRLTILSDEAVMTRDDLAAGRWDGSLYELFQFDWKDPGAGIVVRSVGRIGNVQPSGDSFLAELRDIRQALQSDYTQAMQENCRYRFCDEKCTLDEADYTHAITVDGVASQAEFSSSSTIGSPSEDVFTEGEVRWQTGLNFGLRVKVRDYDADTGTFELAQPMVFPIQVGDTAIAIEGCLKTRAACKDHSNILNFGGEPDKPAVDEITAPAQYDS